MMVGCDDAGTTEFRSAETFQARFPWPSCAGRSTTCVDRGRPSIPLPALHDTPFVCASVTAPRDPVAPADHDLVQQPAAASVTTPHAQRAGNITPDRSSAPSRLAFLISQFPGPP